MKLDPQKLAELEQDWLVVSERFGDLAEQKRIFEVGTEGFARLGRGAVLLLFLDREPRLGYGSQEHVNQQIHTSHFKDSLMQAIQSYNPSEQVLVLVTFDDIARIEDFACQFFGLSKG